VNEGTGIVVEAPIKNPWASTVNWTVFVQMIAGVIVAFLAKYNVIITSEQAAVVIMVVMQIVGGLFIWIKHTWFEPKVLVPSATQLMMVQR